MNTSQKRPNPAAANVAIVAPFPPGRALLPAVKRRCLCHHQFSPPQGFVAYWPALTFAWPPMAASFSRPALDIAGVVTFPQMPEPVQPVGWGLPLLAGGRAERAIGSIRGMGSGPTSVWARKMVPFLSSSLAMLRANFL